MLGLEILVKAPRWLLSRVRQQQRLSELIEAVRGGSDGGQQVPREPREAQGYDRNDEVDDSSVGKVVSTSIDALSHTQWSPAETGFPAAPLTLKSARMCDENARVQLSQSYACPVDPTCLACQNEERAERTRKLAAAWAESAASRAVLYRKWLKPGSTILVQAVNSGQIHLWLNWVCSCVAHGIDCNTSAVVVPTDYPAYHHVTAAGFRAIEPSWTREYVVDPAWEGKQGHRGHGDINTVLLLLAAELLRKGHDILCMDVDFVWLRDPRPWLARAAVGRDILTTLAARWDALGPANTGLVFAQSTFRTRVFFETMINLLPIKDWSDQKLFNALLRHDRLRQVQFRVLPNTLFPRLIAKTWPHDRQSALAVHCVSSWKSRRLTAAGLMYFNGSCPLYDASLYPCAANLSKCKR